MKYIIKYLKKITLGGVLLYTYNIIAVTFNLTIPINFITILMVGIFDFLGLATLIILKIIGI